MERNIKAKLATLVGAALGQANDPSKNDTTLIVNGVAGIRGTEDDKIRQDIVKTIRTYFKIEYEEVNSKY